MSTLLKEGWESIVRGTMSNEMGNLRRTNQGAKRQPRNLVVLSISAALLYAIVSDASSFADEPSGPKPPPSPREFLPPRYLKPEYQIIEQEGHTVLIRKSGGRASTDPRLASHNVTQYDSFINHPCDPCENPTGRANMSGQITEANSQIIQKRFKLGTQNGHEFKLHVLTDPANPNSANHPLFWYEDFDHPIGQNAQGKTIYQRVFLNDDFYTYLPDDHPIRILSRLPPPDRGPLPAPVNPRAPFFSFKGGGTAASSIGAGVFVGGLTNYGTTTTLTSMGMAEESAQHYGAAAGFSSGWMAGEGVAAYMSGGRMFATGGTGGLAMSGPGAALAVHTHIMTSEICPNINKWAEAIEKDNARPSNAKFMGAEFQKRREEYEQSEELLWGYGLGSIWFGVKYWTGYGPKGGIGGGW
jgi:hypothetical protein